MMTLGTPFFPPHLTGAPLDEPSSAQGRGKRQEAVLTEPLPKPSGSQPEGEKSVLNEPTMEKLMALKLTAFAEAWAAQQKNPEMAKVSFDERLGLLVDAEWLHRENARLARYLKDARLRISSACVEDVDCSAKRELDKSVIRQLSSCRWVAEHQNVAITGMTGTGKTYVACALAQQSCRKGYRAIYRRAPRLFQELTLAHADGSYSRLLQRFAKMDLLVIDDWGLAPPKENERRDLLEILEDRYGNRSTIITSQLPTSKWHDHLGDPTIADAICDRILHNAHRLVLKGPSRRKEESTAEK
jgi:DNA replication protein DnaC